MFGKSLQSCPTLWDPMDCLSMGFTRQEYWSGLPCRLPWDLLNPGTEPKSLMSPALASRFFTTSPTWEVQSGETTFELSSMTSGLIILPVHTFKKF